MCNIHVELKFEEREERKIGTEAIIDKTIMAGIFQNQWNIQTRESLSPKRGKYKNSTRRHAIIKLLKAKKKEKVLNVVQRSTHITSKKRSNIDIKWTKIYLPSKFFEN